MQPHILFVRHGQIAANLSHHWHGSTDSPLTSEGVCQANAVSDYLKEIRPLPQIIYTSPLQRAAVTADIIGKRLDIDPIVRSELVEYGIGDLEGTSYRNLAERNGFLDRISRDPHHAPQGGESLHQVLSRMNSVLDEISCSHPDQYVMIVGHGAVMSMTLAYHLEGDAMRWHKYPLHNCSVTKFRVLPEFTLLELNRKQHLQSCPP